MPAVPSPESVLGEVTIRLFVVASDHRVGSFQERALDRAPEVSRLCRQYGLHPDVGMHRSEADELDRMLRERRAQTPAPPSPR